MKNLKQQIQKLSTKEKKDILGVLLKEDPTQSIMMVALFRGYEELKKMNGDSMTITAPITDPDTKEKLEISATYSAKSQND